MTSVVPPLHLLLALEACARHGSFVSAASELSITPSAVSHRIKDLETNVGETLFVRRGRRVQLTIFGTGYVNDVREALDRLSKLARPRLGDARRERLRIASPPTFARQLLVPRLSAFTSRDPGVDIELSVSIPFSDVKAGDADVEIRFTERVLAQAGALPLFEETVFPVASPGYMGTDRLRDGVSATAIAKMKLLHTSGDAWPEWFAAAGFQAPEPRTGHVFNDLGALLEAAANGHGVALARSVLGAGWLGARLMRLSPIEVPSRYAYFAAASSPVAERPLILAFLQWLRSWPEAAQLESRRSSDR